MAAFFDLSPFIVVLSVKKMGLVTKNEQYF